MANLLMTDEEKMLQTMVREFAERELAPRAKSHDEKEEFSWENWRGLASLGLTGIGIDPQYGGTGGGSRQAVIVEEEIARGDASTSVTLTAHLSLGTQTIARYGNEDQKGRFLPALAKGEKLAAWALTESGSGSDAAAMQTTAVLRDGTYYLNGNKLFISNGDIADRLVVFATVDKTKGSKGVSAFVVEKEFPGFIANKQLGKMGMRGSSTAELIFKDTPVPLENRLGEEGSGFRYALEVLDTGRVMIAAQSVGIAQAALEASSRHAQQRQTFGVPIGQHQAIQFMIADMATEVYAARVATFHAATLKDNDLPFISEASMAKLMASEMAERVTSKAVQIFGGYGYFNDSPVERYFRDARVTTIYEGTSEIQRLVIARQVLGQC